MFNFVTASLIVQPNAYNGAIVYIKMATPPEKSLCVLQLGKSECNVKVQRAFRRTLNTEPSRQ